MNIDQSSMDLSTLVDKVRNGEIDLQPDFQRGEVWSEGKKQRLIDTVLRRWYIPAIHIVINDDLDTEEVLDGQQRLRTIIEFMEDKFPVNGTIEPHDPGIQSLDGARYSQLPPQVRSRFRKFTFTTVRLRDYESEEPGELFFRLNQLTALTSAEQRNALIGKPRNQIKSVVQQLLKQLGGHSLGFSNARMNYDDTIARLAVAVETGSLTEKITAASLERRYRSGKAFPQATMRSILSAVSAICALVAERRANIKLNRASLFSWLFFHIDNDFGSPGGAGAFTELFLAFEVARGTAVPIGGPPAWIERLSPDARPSALDEALAIFNDRASSRVNDVNSVLLRDLCLTCAFELLAPLAMLPKRTAARKKIIRSTLERLEDFPVDVAEQSQAEAYMAKQWEQYRASR